MKASALLLIALALPAAADEAAFGLRAAPGRETVQANCSLCHSLDYIPMNSPFLDRKGWEATVTKMLKVMGAPMPPEELPRIVDYLEANYGRAPAR